MSFSRVPPGSGRSSGFTLIEALIALTLLGVALLLGMQLLIQTPRIIRRVDAERQAFRAMEATLEGLRAGGGRLEDQKLERFFTAAGSVAPRDLRVEVDVEPAHLPGLYHVTLTAYYSVSRVAQKKQLETLVWRAK
ncbi:MAG: prepilin-type N-terminal cleavage/methylation domain-containing protein [Thermoanaerobaculia bacterium]